MIRLSHIMPALTERNEPSRIGGVRRHVPIVVGGTVGPPDRAALTQRPLRRIDSGPCRSERDRVALGAAHGSPGRHQIAHEPLTLRRVEGGIVVRHSRPRTTKYRPSGVSG